VRRFDDFQRGLGVARNVLTERLGRLVDEGILEKRAYQERPERFKCERCGGDVDARSAEAMPGPGSRRRWPTAVL
jgi:hypothetical protein